MSIKVGAYVNGSEIENIEEYEAMTGRKLDILNFFSGWTQTFPTETFEWCAARGTTPMYSWDPGELLEQIAAGEEDDHIIAYAGYMAAIPCEVWVRWAWEMNGNWSPYGVPYENTWEVAATNTPERFILAWQRVTTLLRAHAPNVKMVFCPNAAGPDATTGTWCANIAPYWPGSEYVDYTGLDGYNFDNTATGGSQKWTRFLDCFEGYFQGYSAIKVYDKPLIICETSTRAATLSSEVWIRDMFQSLRIDMPDVVGVCWFHKPTEDWGLDLDPAGLAAYADELSMLDKQVYVATVPAASVETVWGADADWATAKALTTGDGVIADQIQPFSTWRYAASLYDGKQYNIQRVKVTFAIPPNIGEVKAAILAIHQLDAAAGGEVTHLVTAPEGSGVDSFAGFGDTPITSFEADGGWSYTVRLLPSGMYESIGIRGDHDLTNTAPDDAYMTTFYGFDTDYPPYVRITYVSLPRAARNETHMTIVGQGVQSRFVDYQQGRVYVTSDLSKWDESHASGVSKKIQCEVTDDDEIVWTFDEGTVYKAGLLHGRVYRLPESQAVTLAFHHSALTDKYQLYVRSGPTGAVTHTYSDCGAATRTLSLDAGSFVAVYVKRLTTSAALPEDYTVTVSAVTLTASTGTTIQTIVEDIAQPLIDDGVIAGVTVDPTLSHTFGELVFDCGSTVLDKLQEVLKRGDWRAYVESRIVGGSEVPWLVFEARPTVPKYQLSVGSGPGWSVTADIEPLTCDDMASIIRGKYADKRGTELFSDYPDTDQSHYLVAKGVLKKVTIDTGQGDATAADAVSARYAIDVGRDQYKGTVTIAGAPNGIPASDHLPGELVSVTVPTLGTIVARITQGSYTGDSHAVLTLDNAPDLSALLGRIASQVTRG